MTQTGPRYPDIDVQLTGEDGNAFGIIGSVRKALFQADVPGPELEEFMAEAMSGDYNNVLLTAMRWVNVR